MKAIIMILIDYQKIRMDIIFFFISKLENHRFSFSPQISDKTSWSLTNNIYSENSRLRGIQINLYENSFNTKSNAKLDFYFSYIDGVENFDILNVDFYNFLPDYEVIWNIRMKWIDDFLESEEISTYLGGITNS